MHKSISLLATLLLAMSTAMAQSSALKLHFDFSNVEGNVVTDAVRGLQAKVMNQAKVTRMGQYGVLDLGNGSGYLDFTAMAGDVVRSLDDFTVSVYYRIDPSASLSGAGYFLWAFSQSDANTQYAAPYMAYRLNAQRMATSTGGWGSETAVALGSESAKGVWKHVLYRQKGQRGELFIDGKLRQQNNDMPLLKETFTAAPAYNWIGRAPFAADSYLRQTLVADFRLYGVAVADEQVAQLADETARLDDAYAYGGGGDAGALLQAVSQAEALLAQGGDYPDGAVAMLQDAVLIAKGMGSQDLNQLAYDNAENDLRQTMAAYMAARGVVFDISGLTDAYSTDRGFRHPGGMHTDEDFARIRRQLAEGNPTVKEAWQKLKTAEYAQPTIQTWPVETIVRGGGSGENYINAARGATMAYQNALRWKIEGTEANAKAAVRILMAWARTCKQVSGDSNWALAAGLYGYEFAQAAELMRDYEGWERDDFDTFKQWMLTVWYPGNINFLRGRNGTWENYVGNQGGIRPGHYWSNWPLCNALAVISIGILCDDVFIYNQGMSFIKYDQVGTFRDQRTANPILNDGCTEFLGNLVVTTHESPLETGAYGKLGQMQESGRDGGHAAMALGLAVDICHVAWNQGDDLFSYMDNRMAAGIEFVAACTQNVQNLPWTNYKYVDCRTAWHNGWLMQGPAEPAEVRGYWGTVIGHYEGVKGVRMPFAEKAYQQMGIDAGGTGGTSGPYDHLGYSVLMNTRDVQLCPEEQRPTLLTPRMEYDGQTIDHNELGGLRNTYVVQSALTLPRGKTVQLMPQLPEGEEDTGLWQWNTGQNTRCISVDTDKSYVYRASYTNKNGVKSEQCFTLAIEGDCTPSPVRQTISVGGTEVGDSVATVFYGDKVTLAVSDAAGWWTEVCWDNGAKGQQTTMPVAADRTVTAYIVSQGGRYEPATFRLKVKKMEPSIVLNGTTHAGQTTIVCNTGDDVVLQAYVPQALGHVTYRWSDGSAVRKLALDDISQSGVYTVEVSRDGVVVGTARFEVLVKGEQTSRTVPTGDYLLHHLPTNTFLASQGKLQNVTLQQADEQHPEKNQVWHIEGVNGRHALYALADEQGLTSTGTTNGPALKIFYFEAAEGINRYAMHTGTGASARYWITDEQGQLCIVEGAGLSAFPFELLPASSPDVVVSMRSEIHQGQQTIVSDLQGRRLQASPRRGIYIAGRRKVVR